MTGFGTRAAHSVVASLAALCLLTACTSSGSGSTSNSSTPTATSQSASASPGAIVTPGPRVGPYDITYVYDGDTAVAERTGERLTVRVVGINTPEVGGPYTQEQCFGPEASARGKQLLLGKQVWLERDPNQGMKDKYDRDLAFIWIDNKEDFGLQMVKGGFAREFTYAKPYPHQAEYKAAQAFAQSNQNGLWSPATCNGRR